LKFLKAINKIKYYEDDHYKNNNEHLSDIFTRKNSLVVVLPLISNNLFMIFLFFLLHNIRSSIKFMTEMTSQKQVFFWDPYIINTNYNTKMKSLKKCNINLKSC